jgi:hypothetical protein
MRTMAKSSKPSEEPGGGLRAPAGPKVGARIQRLRRALSQVRIPSCARYEAYMQELAADYQRLISLGIEGGA